MYKQLRGVISGVVTIACIGLLMGCPGGDGNENGGAEDAEDERFFGAAGHGNGPFSRLIGIRRSLTPREETGRHRHGRCRRPTLSRP